MLDYGLLNLPIHKRGNGDILKEANKFFAAEKRKKEDEKSLRNDAFKSNKEKAAYLYSQIDWELVKAEAKIRDMKFTELRDLLKDMKTWQPKKALAILPMFIKK